jgi:hypothetical protein
MSVERRRATRRLIRQPAIMVKIDGSIFGRCLMMDVSRTGAKLQVAARETVPSQFVLVLSRDGCLRRHCRVAWQSGTTMGVRFIQRLG